MRTTLEQGVLELISTITQTPTAPRWKNQVPPSRPRPPPRASPRGARQPPSRPSPQRLRRKRCLPPSRCKSTAALTALDVVFEENSNRIAQQSATAAETVATRLRAGQGVRMALLAREREADQNPTRRDELTDARIQALRSLLGPARPARSDTHHLAPIAWRQHRTPLRRWLPVADKAAGCALRHLPRGFTDIKKHS